MSCPAAQAAGGLCAGQPAPRKKISWHAHIFPGQNYPEQFTPGPQPDYIDRVNVLSPLSCPEDLRDWAGLDEAGRGCLAGPVVAAAVILSPTTPIAGLADSKKLSPARRAELAVLIKRQALAWGLGLSWPEEIDRINILQATFQAMARALGALMRKYPDVAVPGLLIDGPHIIANAALNEARLSGCPAPGQQAVIKGDARIPAIAAASILAKTHRDRLMLALDKRFPGYGLCVHKGYATKEHYAALQERGPCPLHRLTFAGVAAPRAGEAAKRPSLLTLMSGGV